MYEHVVWSESGPTPAPGNKTTAHAARAVLWVIARRADFNTLDNSYSDLEYIVGTSGAKKSAVYNALSWLEDEGWLYKHNNHACKYACLVPQSAKKIAQSIMQRWECELQLRDKSFYKPEASPIIGNDDPELSDNRKILPINGKCDSNNRNELSNNRNSSPLIGSDFQSSEQPSVSSSVLSTDLTKEEEEVVQGSIDDVNDIDGENPPPPDLILEHQGTPLAAREGILPAEDENKETHHDVEESADAKLQEWVESKLKSFGASIGDSKGVTELRVKLLMSQLAQMCPDADHRTVCEWLKRRLANFAARTFEDRGPNPPNSIHQALEWLETDLSEGSLARFHESKRAEQREDELYNETPHASECNHDQDLILEPRFTSGGKEASK